MTCRHTHTSYVWEEVQVEGEHLGLCVTVQCDDCGADLPSREVPPDVFDSWQWGSNELPRIDEKAADLAVRRQIRDAFGPADTTSKIARIIRK
jgi:hypothetical protein